MGSCLSPYTRSFDFFPIDETKISSGKPTLFSKLNLRIIPDAPRNEDVRVVDGMSLIQSLVYLPSTFGVVLNVVLFRLVRRVNRVYCACETL